MAREVITRILCDVCMDEHEEYVEASETPPITLGNYKPRVLALCETHMKSYEDFRLLVSRLGQVVEPGSPVATRLPGHTPGSGVFPCPVPECPKHERPFKHEQSLRNHARKDHDTPYRELLEQYGQPRRPEGEDESLFPGDTHPAVPKVTEARCPECPQVYTFPEYQRPAQALGVHRAKLHGVRGKKHERKGR